MNVHQTLPRIALIVPLLVWTACSDGTVPHDEPASAKRTEPVISESQVSPLDTWWAALSSLCGNAYAGAMTSEDATDDAFAEQSMTMHVWRCEAGRLDIPFHVGENRSRTWVLTRTEKGMQLQHDHRHEDGSEDEVTLYGGHTEAPGTEVSQSFPVDDFSIKLFEANGLDASVVNVWSMEIVPGDRFSYVLRRPNRHFQVDFDLTLAIDPPPLPWGHE